MISGFLILESTNDGTAKKVSVFAQADATGGMETFQFTILDQVKTTQVNFAPNQGQEVTVVHTASGTGLVTVTATGSPQTSRRILNVDKKPGDTGTAPATTTAP